MQAVFRRAIMWLVLKCFNMRPVSGDEQPAGDEKREKADYH
jgi:hypothetical protein